MYVPHQASASIESNRAGTGSRADLTIMTQKMCVVVDGRLKSQSFVIVPVVRRRALGGDESI